MEQQTAVTTTTTVLSLQSSQESLDTINSPVAGCGSSVTVAPPSLALASGVGSTNIDCSLKSNQRTTLIGTRSKGQLLSRNLNGTSKFSY